MNSNFTFDLTSSETPQNTAESYRPHAKELQDLEGRKPRQLKDREGTISERYSSSKTESGTILADGNRVTESDGIRRRSPHMVRYRETLGRTQTGLRQGQRTGDRPAGQRGRQCPPKRTRLVDAARGGTAVGGRVQQ